MALRSAGRWRDPADSLFPRGEPLFQLGGGHVDRVVEASPGRASSSAIALLRSTQRVGLVDGSAPALSLRTRYCGPSLEARTFRPAAWVSEVIFSSTVPVTVLPWLFHWTLSPRLGFLLMQAVNPSMRNRFNRDSAV